jgi:hypothetical protein
MRQRRVLEMLLTCEYLLALRHSENVLEPVSRYVAGAGVFELLGD